MESEINDELPDHQNDTENRKHHGGSRHTALKAVEPGNTGFAFGMRSMGELKRAAFIFSIFNNSWINTFLIRATQWAYRIRIPIDWLVKPLIFNHFCGGETLEKCRSTIGKMAEKGVRSIPDFSAEGKASVKAFERVKDEVKKAVMMASENSAILFAVFKPTGLAPFELWENLSSDAPQMKSEVAGKADLEQRMDEIFGLAAEMKVPVLVDAEETWIQPAIDHYIRHFSEKYNRERPIVYNTLQMYRTDRLEFIRKELTRAETKDYYLGFKLVRGAYHEKEQERARISGYPSPVFSKKEDTDDAYNEAIALCFEHRNRIAFCAATHNEQSTLLLTRLISTDMDESSLPVTFAQLFGMGDHLTFNLAAAGFIAAKYLPYGPVKEVIPYLIRRAEENKSVAGETSRELQLIRKEIRRRRVEE
jgi:proline dehydrogenase